MNENNKKTSIPLSKSIRDELKEIKITKLETYDEIISRLLDGLKELKKLKETDLK